MMRSYFEKPRTSVGWKGFINDPDLDETFHINKGLRLARQAAARRERHGAADRRRNFSTRRFRSTSPTSRPGWRSARERPRARCIASWRPGLSMPVGFKNGTDGNTQTAVDAVLSARSPHWFPSVTKQGVSAIFQTTGNDTCHVILRGGTRTGPNYDAEHVEQGVREAGGQGAARDGDDRLLARQQPQGSREADRRGRVDLRAGRRRVAAGLGRDDREPPGCGTAGLRARPAGGLRPEHHRRLHLARSDRAAARAAGDGPVHTHDR